MATTLTTQPLTTQPLSNATGAVPVQKPTTQQYSTTTAIKPVVPVGTNFAGQQAGATAIQNVFSNAGKTATPYVDSTKQAVQQYGQQAGAMAGVQSQFMPQLAEQLRRLQQTTIQAPQYAQSQKEALDLQAGRQYEQGRRAMGNIAGSGVAQRQLSDIAFQTGLDVEAQKRKIDTESAERQRNEMLQNLQATSQAVTTEQSEQARKLQALQTASQLGDATATRELEAYKTDTQKDIANNQLLASYMAQMQSSSMDSQTKTFLQSMEQKFLAGNRIEDQDYTTAKSEIDRQMQLALQNNDYEGQGRLKQLQGMLDSKMQEQIQGYNVANRLGSETFQRQMADFDAKIKMAMQSNDIAGQKALEAQKADAQANLQKSQQLWQSFENRQNEAWANGERKGTQEYELLKQDIGNKMQLALQSNDIKSQQELVKLQGEVDKAQLTSELAWKSNEANVDRIFRKGELLSQQDHDKAMKWVDAQIDESKAGNDYARASELQSQKSLAEMSMLMTQNNFADAQRVAQESYEKAKLLSQQQHDQEMVDTQNIYDGIMADKMAKIEEAKAKNDQARLIQLTQEQAKLTSDLETKKQNFQAQTQAQELINQIHLMDNKSRIDAVQMQTQYGHEQAMSMLGYNQQQALAKQDFEQAQVINNQMSKLKIDEAIKNGQIEAGLNATQQWHEKTMQQYDQDQEKYMGLKGFEQEKALIALKNQEQLKLIEKESNLALTKMKEQHGYDKTMQGLDAELQKQMQNNNYIYSKNLEALKQGFEREQNKLDRELEAGRLKLQEKGFNLEQYDTITKNLMNLQQQGIITEDQVVDALNKNLKQTLGDQFVDSLKLDKPDPDKWQKALSAKELQQQYQYAQTHPNSAVYDKNGVFMGLNKESSQTYLAWVNKTLYGQDGKLISSNVNGSATAPVMQLEPSTGWTKSDAKINSNGTIEYDDGVSKKTLPATKNQWIGSGGSGITIGGFALPTGSSFRSPWAGSAEYLKSASGWTATYSEMALSMGNSYTDIDKYQIGKTGKASQSAEYLNKISATANTKINTELLRSITNDIVVELKKMSEIPIVSNFATPVLQSLEKNYKELLYQGNYDIIIPPAIGSLISNAAGMIQLLQKGQIIEARRSDNTSPNSVEVLLVNHRTGQAGTLGFRNISPDEFVGATNMQFNNSSTQPVQKVG
jgi:hypothetical protein